MKKMFVILVSMLLIGTLSNAQEAKMFEIKSGYLKMELDGNTVGTKEFWWDDYGTKTCEIQQSTTTTKIFGIKNIDKTHNITILNNGTFWDVDYIDNLATTGAVAGYHESKSYVNSMTDEERESMAQSIIDGLGGEIEGTEMLGKYRCDILKVMGTRTWLYKGIAIKTEGKILGIVTKETYSIFKPGQSVPASKFNPPSGYEFENINENSGGMWAGMTEIENDVEDNNEKIYPCEYSFEAFKKETSDIKCDGYAYLNTMNLDGSYTTSYAHGMSSFVVIVGESMKNTGPSDKQEMNNMEHFSINGHEAHFQSFTEENDDDEEEGSALIIEYPKHNMYLIIASSKQADKKMLVDIAKQIHL